MATGMPTSSLGEKGPDAIRLNEKGRFTLREGTVGDNTGIDFVYLVDIDADGDLDLWL